MTYQAYETSLELGTPVELYQIAQGVTKWNYTSAADQILYAGVLYTPSPIQRDRIKQSSDTFKDGLRLTFPRDNSFSSQFLGFAPDDVTTVTVFRGHYGDADGEFQTYWKGRVVGARADGNEVSLDCESVFTSIRRPGLRARFEYGCRHTLYGPRCGALASTYKVTGIVSGLTSGIYVSVNGASSQPDGFYTGGMLEAEDGAVRFVTDHVGDQLTLSRPIQSLATGQTAKIYPGCDHLRTTCLSKFNNLDNFGGFPFIPTRNPIDGSSIV